MHTKRRLAALAFAYGRLPRLWLCVSARDTTASLCVWLAGYETNQPPPPTSASWWRWRRRRAQIPPLRGRELRPRGASRNKPLLFFSSRMAGFGWPKLPPHQSRSESQKSIRRRLIPSHLGPARAKGCAALATWRLASGQLEPTALSWWSPGWAKPLASFEAGGETPASLIKRLRRKAPRSSYRPRPEAGSTALGQPGGSKLACPCVCPCVGQTSFTNLGLHPNRLAALCRNLRPTARAELVSVASLFKLHNNNNNNKLETTTTVNVARSVVLAAETARCVGAKAVSR